MHTTTTRLAEWAEKVRRDKGMRRGQIAKELGISLTHFSNLCGGRGGVSFALAERIREKSEDFVQPKDLKPIQEDSLNG